MYKIITKTLALSVVSFIALSTSSVYAQAISGLNVSDVQNIEAPTVGAIETIADDDLNDVQGQALLDFSQQVSADGIQFMKLLINAKLETNLNINELKLGDDIHLRKVSLSGGDGPDSFATLIRPFVEIAMKNYDDEVNRELIGLRVAFEGSEGVLGVGEQDTSQACLDNGGAFCSDYGIEKFHGYFEIADGATAQVDIGAVKLAEYLYTRQFNQDANPLQFNNGGSEAKDTYVPGDPTNGGAAYYSQYRDFLTAPTNNPNSFDDHLINNNLWAGCNGD